MTNWWWWWWWPLHHKEKELHAFTDKRILKDTDQHSRIQVYKCLHTWRLDTCRHSANQCPAFLIVVTCAQLVVVNWTFHVLIWLRAEGERLPTPVPDPGTLYLTVSSTLISLGKPSNAISIPSYCPHAGTFQRISALVHYLLTYLLTFQRGFIQKRAT